MTENGFRSGENDEWQMEQLAWWWGWGQLLVVVVMVGAAYAIVVNSDSLPTVFRNTTPF